MNPLRYRGYYYDNETGYYYLQLRYYDPELGRFISANDFSYVSTYTILSINAYAYCSNDPVHGSDPSGNAKSNCIIDKGSYGQWKWEIHTRHTTNGQRHIHITDGNKEYVQNDDGSPRDGSSGRPSNKIRKHLKEKGKWDWDAKEKAYNEKQEEDNSNSFSLDFSNVGDVVIFTIFFVLCLATGIGLVFIFVLVPPIVVPVV